MRRLGMIELFQALGFIRLLAQLLQQKEGLVIKR